jgi:hypothetical protein
LGSGGGCVESDEEEERKRPPEYPTKADTTRQQKVKRINPERKHRRIGRGRGRKSRKIQ